MLFNLNKNKINSDKPEKSSAFPDYYSVDFILKIFGIMFNFQWDYDLGFLPSDGTIITSPSTFDYLEVGIYENDVYRFDLSTTSNLNIFLDVFSTYDDADLELYRDSNYNGLLDFSDELLTYSLNTGDDSISYQGASADSYFAAVTYFDGGSDYYLDYELEFSAYSQPISDELSGYSQPTIDLDSDLNICMYRFQSTQRPGTYLFVGEEERQNINQNFANSFNEEGIAFYGADAPGDRLMPLYRFQSNATPGTYLFVGEEERQNINQNFADSFTEEGIAFYVYGVGTGEETSYTRFQNSLVPGTYLYATGGEADNIRANFSYFIEEGISFEARV